MAEPADRHVFGQCDPTNGDSACLDEYAECLNHTCRCVSGFIPDPLDYSCSEYDVMWWIAVTTRATAALKRTKRRLKVFIDYSSNV